MYVHNIMPNFFVVKRIDARLVSKVFNCLLLFCKGFARSATDVIIQGTYSPAMNSNDFL